MMQGHVLKRGGNSTKRPRTVCRGESQVYYTESVHHLMYSNAHSSIACNKQGCADLDGGAISQDLATHRYYENPIYTPFAES